jgi:hypothetical protein
LSLVVEYSGGWIWVIGELKALDSFSMVGGRSCWVLSWGGDPGGWAVVAQGELPLLWWQRTESCMGFVLWSGFLVSGGLRCTRKTMASQQSILNAFCSCRVISLPQTLCKKV